MLSVISGKIVQRKLTDKLLKQDEKTFEIGKAFFWTKLINDGMKPINWKKPNRNGTTVHFEVIDSELKYKLAIGELNAYLNYLNEKYGTNLKLED